MRGPFRVLPWEVSPVLQRSEAGRLVTGAEYRGEVSRGHSRRKAGEASEALQRRKVEQTDRPSCKAEDRRPERCPERDLKERSAYWPRNSRTASGEPTGRKTCGWDETTVGAAGEEASVGVHERIDLHFDLICRTAVYVTRMHGGVGGGSRKASLYPKWAVTMPHNRVMLWPPVREQGVSCFP